MTHSKSDEAWALLCAENAALQARLLEAEETLDAIRNGDVDAVVVGGHSGQQIYTLENADRPYRVLIEQMQECALTLSVDGAILYCNQRLSTLTGFTRDVLIGRYLQELVIPDDRQTFDELLIGIPGIRRAAEFSLKTMLGQEIPVNMSVADLTLDDDMPDVLCAVITDLSRSRQRANELTKANSQLVAEIQERERTEDKLRLALDAADMGNWDMDLVSGVNTHSSRFDQIFGHLGVNDWTIERSKGLFFNEDQEEIVEAFVDAQISGIIDLEKRIRRYDDQLVRWVQIKGLTYYRDGEPIRIAGVVSDVTERRLVDEQLRQAQKMEAIGQLTGGVAHDFNNLLMVIAGSLDLLENLVGDSPKASRYLGAARHGVNRGAKLNQQLLAFARRQDLRAESVEIGAFLRSFETLLDRAIGETIPVTIEESPELCYAQTDPHQLETAILNLAINARDAMPQGGSLTLSTSIEKVLPLKRGGRETKENAQAAGDYVVVTVRDTGLGMAPDVVSKVFEPFFTTKELGKGTGLGLSQVYGFAKQSGGFVTIASEVNAGTAIAIHLPRAQASSEAIQDNLPPKEVRGQGIILVVEDDDGVREVACAMLSDLGYSVIQADRGRSALVILESGAPVDLVFTDVIMPGDVGGIDLAREIRLNHQHISLLLTSGYTAQQMLIDGKDDELPILRKPYSRVELSLAVKSAMRVSR